MEISELKKISDRSYDVALAKRNALEKARSRMLLAHGGHLFKADAETINLVKTMSDDHDSFYMLDTNDNPVLIDSPQEFLVLLKAKNQEALNTYHQAYQQFTSIR
jgi:hypothetical protein